MKKKIERGLFVMCPKINSYASALHCIGCDYYAGQVFNGVNMAVGSTLCTYKIKGAP